MTKGRIVWVIALLALVAAACGADPGAADGDPTTTAAQDSTPSTSLEPVEGTVEPADPEGEVPEPGAPLPELPDAKIPRALQPFADAAVADLAERLGVEPTSVTVALAEFVVWPDGGLGCPEPGMVYTQVQVEGSRAVLVHGNSTFFYHGGEGKPGPFLCENLES